MKVRKEHDYLYISYIKLRSSLIAFEFCLSVPLVRFRHPITLLRAADKRIVNIMKAYIERNNLQLELIRYCKMLILFMFTFVRATANISHGSMKETNLRHLDVVSDMKSVDVIGRYFIVRV